jgi:hypothetical protein
VRVEVFVNVIRTLEVPAAPPPGDGPTERLNPALVQRVESPPAPLPVPGLDAGDAVAVMDTTGDGDVTGVPPDALVPAEWQPVTSNAAGTTASGYLQRVLARVGMSYPPENDHKT